jgi:hypothetical protein
LVTVFGGSLSRGRRRVYSYSPTFISRIIAKKVDTVTTSVAKVFPLRLGDSCDSYIIHLIQHQYIRKTTDIHRKLFLMKVERRVNTNSRDALEDGRLALYYAEESMNCTRAADCPHLKVGGMETGSCRRGFRSLTKRPDPISLFRPGASIALRRTSPSFSPLLSHCRALQPCPPVLQRVCSPLVWCNAAPPLFSLLSFCWQAPAWIMCFEYLRLQQY